MEHVVFYPSAEGVPTFTRCSTLEEARSLVEHLRNSEDLTEFQVHALTAVPLHFRAYYHVEVPGLIPAADTVTEPFAVADHDDISADWVADAPVHELPVLQARLVEAPVATAPEAGVTGAEATDAGPAFAVPAVAVAESTYDPATRPADPFGIGADDAPHEAMYDATPDTPAEFLDEPLALAVAPMASQAASQSYEATPFATAPPVMPQVTDALSGDHADPAAYDPSSYDPDAADAAAGVIPSGRRSMGFFAR